MERAARREATVSQLKEQDESYISLTEVVRANTENVLGEHITQGTYSRKPEEYKARIIRHLGLLCPEVFADELERLIR